MSPERTDYAESASELVQELVRAFKARRLYDADHPERRDIEERATGRIGSLLDLHGTIELEVEEDALAVDDTVVYRQEGRESLPRSLHREGVRKVIFYTGLARSELAAFLDHLARSARETEEERDEGLIGRLWQESFTHLRYTFVEDLKDAEWVPPSAERDEHEDKGRIELDPEDRAAAEDPRGPVSDFDGTLYFLDDEDMASLQAELEAERSRGLLHEGLTCLRELLIHPVRQEPIPLLEALAEMQERLLDEGSWDEIRKLHQLFVPYLESDGCGERGRIAFARMREAALSEPVLGRLADAVESGSVEEQVAAGYYRTFGREDPIRLLALVGDLKKLFQHSAIAGALAELGRERIDELSEALGSDDPRLASAAAWLAGHLGDPRLIDGLARCLDSSDAEVRRDALQALKQFGGGRSLQVVAGTVDDPDPTVRLYALRHLVAHRYAPALPRISEIVESDGWRERPPTEQRLVFEAYGALGGERVVKDLIKRLERRSGLFRSADPEELACVVVGLGATGTEEAHEAVEEATEHKHALVRRTARQVLGSWDGSAATGGR
ncbi:MAG: HEAT repeat domain-containing protein [Gemmatimonadota bacterium]|nr:HEAT repeat domain-containing protein [Gemmatimonadota bacterium]